ncbi:MAG: hypothetical protein A2731_03835 [Candidatus Buchananbacteria bacterium RIFCSPHIGHO2_01_FULL_39_8]|uniref:DUF5668 domain-containing protein n=1 Tax=Candidatus Buchananbacteria bacterium RIFCSPHIGHO2_01_FULL_39_8 TaxID=1797533 RepID=A0A1G1XTZ6_9BACT|nr:MAG: hypothetical protein A2731_03835 [Candidatus Buchananbacteria bacterium RIFCSPHIGHO2_01_FULL_39_8]
MRIKIDFIKLPHLRFWPRLNRSIFRVFFITFLLLFIIDLAEPGFVTNWFNPVWLLIIALISAIIFITKD